jgi:hypothetical protein
LPGQSERLAKIAPILLKVLGLVPQVVGEQRGLLPGSQVSFAPICEFQQGAVASLLKALGYLEPRHALEDWEQIQPALDRS